MIMRRGRCHFSPKAGEQFCRCGGDGGAVMRNTTDSPELWGGIECTLNRVGDHYHNQLAWNGHLDRPDDLELIAALGIKTLRYPVLWEMVAPDDPAQPEWRWTDERLGRLRELGIEPVAGLLHHGSGPRYTSLIDPDFPKKLAGYARQVAQRYPWLKRFSPVNEPLTTARFSGLYGHWYPHGTEDRLFVRALLQQCRGIVEAIRAIREVTPGALLVVPEDMGRTSSTRVLQYQADFENHRRWLSLDLLAGLVLPEHPLAPWLTGNGADAAELAFFLENPVMPDLVGINYYLTSDRYLDHRLDRYPASLHGGNHRHRYADVEAVRACPHGIVGHEALLRSAWHRYGTEVAITEVHLGAHPEEQLRWFHEAWEGAVRLRAKGVPVRAVTAWSLFGSFDWHNLVTDMTGAYEPGVFDVRGPRPRPTALAASLMRLGAGGGFDHHTIGFPGWWRRPDRFLPHCRPARLRFVEPGYRRRDPHGVLIVGKTGTLGQAFARICESRGIYCHVLSRGEIDIASETSVAAALNRYHPWAVINCAGFVRIDEAEEDSAGCFRENTQGPALLAAACADRGVALLTFSSDMVFDGAKKEAYREADLVSPLNVYGMSKAEAERQVLQIYPQALVIRSSAFFGPWDEYNFVTVTLRRLAQRDPVTAASDLVVSPTYVPDLVHASLGLLLDGACGIWHVSNDGSISWADLASSCAKLAGLDHRGIVAQPAESFGLRARRPPFSALATARGIGLPSLDDALRRYFFDSSILQRLF